MFRLITILALTLIFVTSAESFSSTIQGNNHYFLAFSIKQNLDMILNTHSTPFNNSSRQCFIPALHTLVSKDNSVSTRFFHEYYAKDVFVSKDRIYVTGGFPDLEVFSTSQTAAPIYGINFGDINHMESIGESIYVDDKYVYVACGTAGFHILNKTDLHGGGYMTPRYALSVYPSGNYAYVTDVDGGLMILDVTDYENPNLVGSYVPPQIAVSVFVQGNYAYLGCDDGLRIVNVTDKTGPSLTGSYTTSWEILDLHVNGSIAYLANGINGLLILNVSDPANPTLLGSCSTPGYASGIFLKDNYAYIADGDAGITKIDITDPSNPRVSSTHPLPIGAGGGALKVFMVDSTAYIAAGTGGLKIMNLEGTAIQVELPMLAAVLFSSTQQLNPSNIILLVIIILAAGLAVTIYLIRRATKPPETIPTQPTPTPAKTHEEHPKPISESIAEPKTITCPFCGTKQDAKNKECSKCGAVLT